MDAAFENSMRNNKYIPNRVSTMDPKRTPFPNLCFIILPLLPSLLYFNPPNFAMFVKANHYKEQHLFKDDTALEHAEISGD